MYVKYAWFLNKNEKNKNTEFCFPVNRASLVYKLYIAFQARPDTKHCFYWIVFSTGIFKNVNLVLLAYQSIVGVGSVNCTTCL